MRPALAALLLSGALAACSHLPGVPEREHAGALDERLVRAGFRGLPADTAAKQAHLEQMPKLLFVTVVRDGQRRYLLAEPYHCRCLYVGDTAAYQRYADLEGMVDIGTSGKATAREESDAREVDHYMDSVGPYDVEDVFGLGTQP